MLPHLPGVLHFHVNRPLVFTDEVCFFQDLGSKDINADAYLVAHIVRIGGSHKIYQLYSDYFVNKRGSAAL